MATTPDLQEPQITAARAKAWQQTGEAMLTLEAARNWLNQYGLVLFSPRGSSLGAPAPSLVEATLGAAKTTATLAETETARTLTARLVGEGSAVPLNLLGGPGDLPDFLVSAQAFPFVFTLRGDKGWKRPPETSGAVKVTPLGLRIYEVLAERGALTIADVVSEIGREVTESAVARALSELWQLLRVIPVLQQGQGETLWELATARFQKGIKAGANAGQPTALSGLVSLYLSQAYVATEEEVAAFLSPLTARSRVRDVLHALVAGRQLAEGVINGKTVLYVPELLPDFSEFAPAEEQPSADAEAASAEETVQGEASEAPRERIRKFGQDKGGSGDRNFRGKPLRKDGEKRPSLRTRPEGERRPREDRGGEGFRPERRSFSADRERPSRERPAGDRPFRGGADRERPARAPRAEGGFRERREGGERPSFSRPWDEERGSRPPRKTAGGGFGDRRAGGPPRRDRETGEGQEGRPARPFAERRDARPPRRDGERPYARREDAGEGRSERPAPRGDRPQRPFRPRSEEGGRPFRPREGGSGEGGRSFRPRAGAAGEGGRPFRPREGSAGEGRPFRPREAGAGGDRPFRPREGGAGGGRPFRPREVGAGGDRPFRPREGGAQEGGFGARRGPGRPAGGGFNREGRGPAGASREGRGGSAGGRGGFRPAGRKAPGKFAGRSDRPARRPRPEDEA